MPIINRVLLIVGITLSAIGLIFPIPGPLDDPMDYIGYAITALTLVREILAKKNALTK